MPKYIAKPNTWFDEGTTVKSIWNDGEIGLFQGYRTCVNPNSEARPLGKTYIDEEMCRVDEFEVIGDD